MQYQDRPAIAARHVVHRHITYRTLHPATLSKSGLLIGSGEGDDQEILEPCRTASAARSGEGPRNGGLVVR
jgi:hypothetical protein